MASDMTTMKTSGMMNRIASAPGSFANNLRSFNAVAKMGLTMIIPNPAIGAR